MQARQLLGRYVLGLGTALSVTLTGCAVGPNYRTPATPTPAAFAAAATAPAPAGQGALAAASPAVDLARWWRVFSDPELDSLVERAVRANPDLQIALDRLQEARTYEIGAISVLLPVGEASGGAARGTGSDLGRGRAAQALVSAVPGTGTRQVAALGGFDAAWELDFFGKYRRELEAARADTQALAATRNAVLVAVVSDVARAYVDLRGAQARSAALHSSIRVLQQSLSIVRERFERGITNELDLTLAQRELDTLLAAVAPLDAQIQALQYTIATLLGRYPEDLVKELSPPQMLPALPARIDAGMPVDLLRRRPDIIAAERQLAASNARIGVAVGSLFPQVALTGSIGAANLVGGGLAAASQHVWSAGPAAAWPLLDFGALDAQVQIARLETRSQLVSYRATIQKAVQEVDTALSGYVAQQASIKSLEEALVASQRAVFLAQQRYERGFTDFLYVVDAERQQYALEEQYAQTQTSACEQLIAFYRGLGGGWQDYQSLPPVRRPLPAVAAMFRSILANEDPLSDPDAPVTAVPR
jgi:NodT family efflux transporter outer membrane factor (OMF) lipoprotein